MNAVLGQMAISLDQALPAKVVSVELDQVYFLQTTSGYYTPCPSCARDSWFSTFSAFPSSSMGTGLQAVGHTTQRDEFSTNTTAPSNSKPKSNAPSPRNRKKPTKIHAWKSWTIRSGCT